MVVTGATNVVVEQAGLISLPLGSRLAFLLVLQDRSDRAVGTGVEGQRLGAGGVQPFGAIAFAQAENANAGAEPLFRMRPRNASSVIIATAPQCSSDQASSRGVENVLIAATKRWLA